MLPLLERTHYFLPDAGLRLLDEYIQRCRDVESEPDAEILGRMHAVLVSAGMVVQDEPLT